MTDLNLASIAHDLQQPFALEAIKYLPKAPRKKNANEWVCLALPYADKRTYEDRLNDLAFGYWSTPYTPPSAVGNKLVIPVTVTICGVTHTDYGEAFLQSKSRKGEVLEEEHSATEAYSQGFRRACAQFRLGRYLYRLPKAWVPYDPESRTIALKEEQKYQFTRWLYTQAGVCVPESTTFVAFGGSRSSREQVSPEPDARSQTSSALIREPRQYRIPPVAPASSTALSQTPSPASTAVVSVEPVAASTSKPVPMVPEMALQGTLQEHKRRWLERQLKHDVARIQRICEQYQVQCLEQLSEIQYVHLANRFFAAKKRAQEKQRATSSLVRVAPASISAGKQQ